MLGQFWHATPLRVSRKRTATTATLQTTVLHADFLANAFFPLGTLICPLADVSLELVYHCHIRRSRYMDEKPRIVAYKLIIDANIVKHRAIYASIEVSGQWHTARMHSQCTEKTLLVGQSSVFQQLVTIQELRAFIQLHQDGYLAQGVCSGNTAHSEQARATDFGCRVCPRFAR
jgi:hypothetical protein